MKYLDTNIFVYPITDPGSSRANAAKELLLKVAAGEEQAATSALTWDEFVWTIRKASNADNAVKEGKKFLGLPNLTILRVDGNILYLAQKVMESYKTAPRDSIHIATAVSNGITEFVSSDPDFDAVKEIRRISPERA